MEMLKGIIVICGFAYLFSYPIVLICKHNKVKKQIQELKKKLY